MSIVVNSSSSWVKGASYVGYDSLYLRLGAVVAANVEDTDQPASNATSWLVSGGGWQATGAGDKTLAVTLVAAANANSYAIYKHNLGTLGLTVKLQHSSDGIAWTDLAGSEKNPAVDTAIYFVGASISAKYWRIHIAGLLAGETLIVGQAFISESLNVFSPPEPGWTPPSLAPNNKYINSRSDGGDFLGRTLIRKGAKTMFQVSVASQSWIRANWLPFMDAAELHPFYHAWDTTQFPLEVAFCYTDGPISKPRYVNPRFMSFDLKFFALLE